MNYNDLYARLRRMMDSPTFTSSGTQSQTPSQGSKSDIKWRPAEDKQLMNNIGLAVQRKGGAK